MVLYLQKTNTILETIYKAQYYFGTYLQRPNTILATIYEAKILFWHLFIKPNIILAHIYKSPDTILLKIIILCSKPKTIPWKKHIFLY